MGMRAVRAEETMVGLIDRSIDLLEDASQAPPSTLTWRLLLPAAPRPCPLLQPLPRRSKSSRRARKKNGAAEDSLSMGRPPPLCPCRTRNPKRTRRPSSGRDLRRSGSCWRWVGELSGTMGNLILSC